MPRHNSPMIFSMKKAAFLLLILLCCLHTKANPLDDCMSASRQTNPLTLEICQQALAVENISKDDQSKVYISQANFLITNSQFIEANKTLDLALNKNPKILQNGRYRYNWLRAKGLLFFNKEEYMNALPYYEQAMEVAKIMGESQLIALSYNDLGALNSVMFKYQEALEWLQKSLDIQYKLENHKNAALSLSNIAEIYLSLEQPEKALDYFNQSLKLHEKSIQFDPKNKDLYDVYIAKIYLSIAIVQNASGAKNEALSNLNKALQIYQQYELKGQQVNVLSALGKMYIEDSKIKQAIDVLEQAQDIESTLESQDNLELKINRVTVNMLAANWQQAEQIAIIGLSQARSKMNLDMEVKLLEQLAQIYKATGRLTQSIDSLEQLQAIKAELLKSKFNKSRGILLAEIELGQKQRALAKLEREHRIAELNTSKQLLIFTMIGLLLISFIAYLLYLLKRKGKLKKDIQTDQAAHHNQLNMLSVDKDKIKQLFSGLTERFICFDSTGFIHHHANDVALVDNSAKMQQNFPKIWQMVLPNLNQEEKLESDLLLDLDTSEADGIWVHQMAYLDDMLVCLLLSQEKQNSQSLKHAECIRKYSEFKLQLADFVVNSRDFPIHKSAQLNQVTLAMKAINKVESPITAGTTQSEFKAQLVDLMITCVETWQTSTNKGRIELAEESGLWLVGIEEGHLRTRTMDRYSDINKIPENPRWRQVVKTAHYILSNCQLSINDRQQLNLKTEMVKQVLRCRATGLN